MVGSEVRSRPDQSPSGDASLYSLGPSAPLRAATPRVDEDVMVDRRSGRWTTEQSAELYNLPGWGQPYFSVADDGRMCVHPDGAAGPSAVLEDVVAEARRAGSSLPLLLRFDGILGHRVNTLHGLFRRASTEFGFTGRHRPVYPIKVNQQRQVVEALLELGRDDGLGLEVGSKPELMAVVALLDQPSLMICNGYKDEAYIEMACLAVRLGHEVVVVIEKPSEIETYERVVAAEGRDAAPWLGLRARMASRGSGRWESSSGDRAKFGLSATQLVEAVDWLGEVDLLEQVKLLHFHIGSQITAIRPWKQVLREASRLYVELKGMGCPLDTLDVGGGLAVDYDGSRTRFESSMSYSEGEYANDVVWHIQQACDEAGLPHPDIVTESGRALAAHHAVLLTEVVGASRHPRASDVPPAADDEHDVVRELRENLTDVTRKNMLEAYHDALGLREDMLQRFGLGLVDLRTRALSETIYFATLELIARLAKGVEHLPEDLEGLDKQLADLYFCNFSLFQSVPDHWAIRHVFPVMPITRLDEEPTERALLGDMTCDSDGKMDRFPDQRDVKDVLEVHELREGEPYVMGIFLVGAYQEILGDLHNLFGDTDAAHVRVEPSGEIRIVGFVPAEQVGEVLQYVEYDEAWLAERYERHLRRLVSDEALTAAEAEEVRADLRRYLAGPTYLTAGSVRTARADDLAEQEDLESESVSGLDVEELPA